MASGEISTQAESGIPYAPAPVDPNRGAFSQGAEDRARVQSNQLTRQEMDDNNMLSKIAQQSYNPQTQQMDWGKYQGMAATAPLSGKTKMDIIEKSQPQRDAQIMGEAIEKGNGNIPATLAALPAQYRAQGMKYISENGSVFTAALDQKKKFLDGIAQQMLQVKNPEDKVGIYLKGMMSYKAIYHPQDTKSEMPLLPINTTDPSNPNNYAAYDSWAQQNKLPLTNAQLISEEKNKFGGQGAATLKLKYPWIADPRTDPDAVTKNTAHVDQLIEDMHKQGAFPDEKAYHTYKDLNDNGNWYNAIQELDKLGTKGAQTTVSTNARVMAEWDPKAVALKAAGMARAGTAKTLDAQVQAGDRLVSSLDQSITDYGSYENVPQFLYRDFAMDYVRLLAQSGAVAQGAVDEAMQMSLKGDIVGVWNFLTGDTATTAPDKVLALMHSRAKDLTGDLREQYLNQTSPTKGSEMQKLGAPSSGGREPVQAPSEPAGKTPAPAPAAAPAPAPADKAPAKHHKVSSDRPDRFGYKMGQERTDAAGKVHHYMGIKKNPKTGKEEPHWSN